MIPLLTGKRGDYVALEKLLSVDDICERYQCTENTARKYMREMYHREKPLMVTERAVKEWDAQNSFPPEKEIRLILKRKGAAG